jgi:hypothetical protein
MKLEVDENLPPEIAVSLREAGHDALTVFDQGLGGHADLGLAERARSGVHNHPGAAQDRLPGAPVEKGIHPNPLLLAA